MSTLTVRKLDPDTKERLRIRAAQHGRSMEAEAREILRGSLAPAQPRGVGSRIHQRLRHRAPAGPWMSASGPRGTQWCRDLERGMGRHVK